LRAPEALTAWRIGHIYPIAIQQASAPLRLPHAMRYIMSEGRAWSA
jgi:hypothetical protein